MATYGKWITKSTCIGATLGGVAGFFYAAYIMATFLLCIHLRSLSFCSRELPIPAATAPANPDKEGKTGSLSWEA